MRTIFAFEMITLDGYYAGPSDELDWHNVDAEFETWALAQLDRSDTIVFGRATYEGMAAYWPGVPAADPTAQRMNGYSKVVVSRTLQKADWNNSRIVRGLDDIAELKRQPGKDIAVFGSFDLTVHMIEAGLLDELRVIVNPIVLGAGKSLFTTTDRRIGVRLKDVHRFDSGNVLLTYSPIRPA